MFTEHAISFVFIWEGIQFFWFLWKKYIKQIKHKYFFAAYILIYTAVKGFKSLCMVLCYSCIDFHCLKTYIFFRKTTFRYPFKKLIKDSIFCCKSHTELKIQGKYFHLLHKVIASCEKIKAVNINCSSPVLMAGARIKHISKTELLLNAKLTHIVL